MNRSAILVVLCFMAAIAFAGDGTATNESEAVQREKLYQRFLKEMREGLSQFDTNVDSDFDTPFTRRMFDQMVVHPSFGWHWDEVPAPTITGSNAMAAVDAFIATNGWEMQKDNRRVLEVLDFEQSKPISGLPWAVIHEREFP